MCLFIDFDESRSTHWRYVGIYVYMYVFIYIYIYIDIYVCLCVEYDALEVCMHHMCVRIWTHICMYIRVRLAHRLWPELQGGEDS